MRTRLPRARHVHVMKTSSTWQTMAQTLSGSGCTMALSMVGSLNAAPPIHITCERTVPMHGVCYITETFAVMTDCSMVWRASGVSPHRLHAAILFCCWCCCKTAAAFNWCVCSGQREDVKESRQLLHHQGRHCKVPSHGAALVLAQHSVPSSHQLLSASFR